MTASTRRDTRTLAAAGGVPVRSRPMPGWPAYDECDLCAVQAVLASGKVNYWTGNQGRSFEREFAQWAGVPHGVAVMNGTAALELALGALGIGAGDDVIVPAATFIGTASAVARLGATPVVADVDADTQCLTAHTAELAMTRRTRAIVAVHKAGVPAPMASLRQLARGYGLWLVEDCAQAHGARQADHMVGTFGDIAAWSFCQDKIITTAGEGGAVTTADEDLWRKVWAAKDHGKRYDLTVDRPPSAGFGWVHDSFGTNARMTEVQAAVGRNQLRKVAGWLDRRRRHAAVLHAELAGAPALRVPAAPDGTEPAWYRFFLYVRPDRLGPGWDRDRVVAAVRAEGVPCQQGGCFEIHRERAFDGARPRRGLPVAAELGRTGFALLVHPTLSDDDIRDTVEAVRKVAEAAAR